MKTGCLVRLLALTAAALLSVGASAARPALLLDGYTDPAGAITVLHGGASADPYFALQALLLAHDNGLDISVHATAFADWLVPRQKPDGTFDRFCRQGDASWMACQAADADDSLLAMWMRLLEAMPAKLAKNPAWTKSHAVSQAALAHLFQPSRGVYMVSPLVLHGLFMDNLEVWSLQAHRKQPGRQKDADALARAIQATFWNPVDRQFLVSTQLEQRAQKPAFYPTRVAQVFPLLVDFPLLPGGANVYYRDWMAAHRAEWLRQGELDYPWGVLAVLALRQNDIASARCWLRDASALRHSPRWAVTDEVSIQVLYSKGLSPADRDAACQ